VFAIKVRRPGIERVLDTDLALLRGFARVLARIPPLRGVPVVAIVDQLASCVRGQLDFGREASMLRELHENLDGENVRVPRVVPHLCTADVLVMEHLDGLDRNVPGELTAEQRHRAVILALRAAYRMIFLHGLVHCDLHPGNLYFRRGGSVAIVDAGFTVRLTQFVQTKFTAFFYCMSLGDGRACAEVVLATAATGPKTDVAGFRRELAQLVETHSRARAADFDLMSFASRLFDVQRRHRLYADPQFVLPILSLLVLEGAVRELHPEVDFQREAMPFLTAAVLKRAATVTDAHQ
jgi:ubiquinone biosynthesis protein